VPEGDTVWLTAHRLHAALSGRVVTLFDLRVPDLALSDLTGATVTEVLARGKHILMRFDDGLTLHSHLRMDGSWRIDRARRSERTSGSAVGRPVAARPASGRPTTGRLAAGRPTRSEPRDRDSFDVRVIIGNVEWTASGARVHDLELAHTDDEARWVGHLGPDILGPDWDAARAAANLGADDRPLVEALLDQRNLAGVGNMYAAELMFLAGVHPLTPATNVTKLDSVVRTAFKALRANRDHPEQSTTGRTARGEQHWVYLRTGQPCRRCRTPIVTGEFGQPPRQRNTFWCPHCQPFPDAGPLDRVRRPGGKTGN
jgi:endonuclease-8